MILTKYAHLASTACTGSVLLINLIFTFALYQSCISLSWGITIATDQYHAYGVSLSVAGFDSHNLETNNIQTMRLRCRPSMGKAARDALALLDRSC
jgi:hypothetical protein